MLSSLSSAGRASENTGFTARKRSCGKVMFLQLPVCSRSRGVCFPTMPWAGRPPFRRQTPPPPPSYGQPVGILVKIEFWNLVEKILCNISQKMHICYYAIILNSFWVIITAHKRSCGKVMFSQACVSHSIHGGVGSAFKQCNWQTDRLPQSGGRQPSIGRPGIRYTSGRHSTGMHTCFCSFYRPRMFTHVCLSKGGYIPACTWAGEVCIPACTWAEGVGIPACTWAGGGQGVWMGPPPPPELRHTPWTNGILLECILVL